MSPTRVGTQEVVKRLFDVTLAAVLLLPAAPIMGLCGALIRLRSPGPAIFRQQREGRAGQPFEILKLRTMHQGGDAILARHLDASPEARLEWERFRRLRDDPRVIGGIGRWLRQTSIDELPQLINVLRAEMSIVGPRPLELPVAAALPPLHIADRRRVRPGITGLWQVSGRSDHDLIALCELDAAYVQSWSLRSDLAILWRTPAAVLSRRGAY